MNSPTSARLSEVVVVKVRRLLVLGPTNATCLMVWQVETWQRCRAQLYLPHPHHQRTRTGLSINTFFSICSFYKKIIDLSRGQINVSLSRVLSGSSQEDNWLGLSSLKGFLSWHSALQGSSTSSHISTKTSKPGPADFRKKLVGGIFGILETPSIHCRIYHDLSRPLKAFNWGTKSLKKAGSHRFQ